jgi:hypothetical protein
MCHSARASSAPLRAITFESTFATQMTASSACAIFCMIRILSLMLPALLFSADLRAQTPVTTWHYDNGRTGANTSEFILTPSNVNVRTFGKLSTQPVDGFIVGQPLYLPGINLPGQGMHNVVYVATMHDSVYAFDADNPNSAPLWMTSLLAYSPAGATTVPSSVKKNAGATGWTELGVISTPVIDPSSGTLYLVAETYENGNVVHRLHALDVTTGVEKLGGPTTIAATYTLNGVTTTFTDLYQMNRPGLLLANGHVYVAFGSNCCNLYSQGWVMSYNASTLQQEGAFCAEPGQTLASVWQKGAGLSADSDGNIYAGTGEGFYAPGTNLSTSIFKISQIGTSISLVDWFTPFNYQSLSANDLDLAMGVLILPDQAGPTPHELVSLGKQGSVYVLNRDNMGQLCTKCTTMDTQIVQELPNADGESGSPVYWNGLVYFTGTGVPVMAYPLSNGLLMSPPTQSAQSVRAGGAHALITANGNSNGVLWFLNVGASTLVALDAITLQTLYLSGLAPNGRDTVPPLAHFATPIVADGQVFVGTQTSLLTYGLLPSTTTILSSNLNPSSAGAAVTFTATVTPANIPNGETITFKDGPTVLGTSTLSSGTASITVSTLPIGTNSISAAYPGDSTFAASSGTLSQKVTKDSTTTTLSSSLNPSMVGTAVTFTASVSSASGNIPDGETVTFKTGATLLGSDKLANGTASVTVSTLAAGTQTISAAYSGDSTFASSFGTLSQKVIRDSTTTTLSSSLNPSTAGTAVTFTATVSSASGNIPNGETVTFRSGTTVLGTGALSGGVATIRVSTLPTGTDSVSAAYGGDATFSASSAALRQVVNP